MTAVQLLALSTPAVIGAALLSLAYWVRNQNRSPVPSNGVAQTQQTVWADSAAGTLGASAPASSADISEVAAETSDFTREFVITYTIASSEEGLADLKKAVAELQSSLSRARIAAGSVSTK